jgi:hypothetical protein
MMGFSRKEWAMLVSDGEQQNAPKKGGFRAALLASKSGAKEGGPMGDNFRCHRPACRLRQGSGAPLKAWPAEALAKAGPGDPVRRDLSA